MQSGQTPVIHKNTSQSELQMDKPPKKVKPRIQSSKVHNRVPQILIQSKPIRLKPNQIQNIPRMANRNQDAFHKNQFGITMEDMGAAKELQEHMVESNNKSTAFIRQNSQVAMHSYQGDSQEQPFVNQLGYETIPQNINFGTGSPGKTGYCEKGPQFQRHSSKRRISKKGPQATKENSRKLSKHVISPSLMSKTSNGFHNDASKNYSVANSIKQLENAENPQRGKEYANVENVYNPVNQEHIKVLMHIRKKNDLRSSHKYFQQNRSSNMNYVSHVPSLSSANKTNLLRVSSRP